MLSILLPCTYVRADSQQLTELRKLAADAQFYASQNGRPAEAACFMRKIQRLHFGPESVIKKWYQEYGMDDGREVLMRLMVLWVLLKQEAPINNAAELEDEVIKSVTKREYAKGVDSALSFAEALKTVRGENDPIYVAALEVIGDLQALQRKHVDAAKTFSRIIEVGRSLSPDKERAPGDLRSEYNIKKDTSFCRRSTRGLLRR
jgi:hypothetical protein